MDFHGCALIGNGTAALDGCAKLQLLDLSDNSLTLLPANLPLGLTHFYLGSNPIQATAAELGSIIAGTPVLAAFDVGFLGLPVDMSATQVSMPTGCRLGPDPPRCAFVLNLYTSPNTAVKVGGLKPNLTLGTVCEEHMVTYHSSFFTKFGTPYDAPVNYLHPIGRRNCALSTPMKDLGDGRYEAVIPVDWAPYAVPSPVKPSPLHGPYDPGQLFLTVGFFDGGEEFFPVFDANSLFHPDWEFGCPSLRAVAYGCPSGAHTGPATGPAYVCAPGYTRDANTNASAAASCHKVCHNGTMGAACDHCPAGLHHQEGACRRCPAYAICLGGSLDSAVAAPCPLGRQPDAAGKRCEACPAGKASSDMAVCTTCDANQEPALGGTRCGCVPGHYNTSRLGGRSAQCIAHDFRHGAATSRYECSPCDAMLDCATCDGGGLQQHLGWGQAGGEEPTPWNIMRCPLRGSCLGDEAGYAVGFTGLLCAECDAGYDRTQS
jgi:hypothetical protein